MRGDLIAGFSDQKCAGITEIADGLDLVVLGHERDGLSDKLVRLPDEVVQQIGHILGVDHNHHLIVIGAGNLGHALLRNFPFAATGFTVDAAFDTSPELVGTSINGVTVHPTSELETFIQENPVDVVVLTIPQNAAQNTANRLIDLGIQGFWNFTNVELTSTRPNVKIENIHFADSLLTLSYRIANS